MQTTEAITSDQELEFAATLATALPSPPRMPPVELRLRVRTSPALRRLLPTRLMVSRAVRRGQALWEQSPAEREEAMAAVATVIARTPRAREMGEIARGHLIESEADGALFWQPWSTPGLDAVSTERLRDALVGDRGVVLSPCHTGPYPGSPELVLKALGYVPQLVAGPWFFDTPSPDPWGRRLARWRKGSRAPVINAKGSFPILVKLLERNVPVHLFFDMPGPHKTCFLGKPAMLADGSARLAVESGALIVPIRTRRRGHDRHVDVAGPLDPREFAGVEEIHCALAAQHERWILERPEEMTDPRSFGWVATPDAWDRPRRADRPR
jgi:lauroyl/myristoyl acyltransferase